MTFRKEGKASRQPCLRCSEAGSLREDVLLPLPTGCGHAGMMEACSVLGDALAKKSLDLRGSKDGDQAKEGPLLQQAVWNSEGAWLDK